MKKALAILMLIFVVSTVSACGGTTSKPIETGNEQPSSMVEETTAEETEAITDNSDWFIPVEVDAFGDVVEDSDNVSLKSIVYGDFSNTATASSELTVEILDLIYNNHVFGFSLLEYDDTPATFSSSSDLSLKVKIGDMITDYSLDGVAPNGYLFLGNNNTDGNEIHDALYEGNDVRCIITIDSSKYNFTISSKGFKDLCAEAQEKLDAITEKNRVKDLPSIVKALLESEDGAAKLLEAYDYLSDSREDYTLMSDADIEKEIEGDFYYVSLNQYKDNGIVSTYRYIMNYSNGKRTQKLYWKYGISDENPERQDYSYDFVYSDGLITKSKSEFLQLRKMADGYYVAYESDGKDYTIPAWVIMKGEEDSTEFIFENPLY